MITETKTSLFGLLCESILTESTIISLLGKSPRVVTLTREIYKAGDILHNSPLVKVDKIQSNLPGRQARIEHNYIIIGETNDFLYLKTKGERGGEWEFYYVNNDNIIVKETFHTLAGAKNYIKTKIGKIKDIYSYNINLDLPVNVKHREKLQARRQYKQYMLNQTSKFDVSYLTKKFSPLFLKIIQNAEAEMKGMLMTMVRNGYYTEAHKKVDTLKSLTTIIDKLEADPKALDHDYNLREWWSNKVEKSVHMAALYLYPDVAGGMVRGRVTHYEAIVKLLQSLNDGNLKNLSVILQFFKNNVVRGL